MLEASAVERHFWLFDSFEGLFDSTKGKDSLVSAVDPKQGKRIFAGDVEKVRTYFLGRDNVHLLAGWIPARFGEISDRKFALVHIDVDLYHRLGTS
jgi:O-methyltransferase